jgi:hypothetical protein
MKIFFLNQLFDDKKANEFGYTLGFELESEEKW